MDRDSSEGVDRNYTVDSACLSFLSFLPLRFVPRTYPVVAAWQMDEENAAEENVRRFNVRDAVMQFQRHLEFRAEIGQTARLAEQIVLLERAVEMIKRAEREKSGWRRKEKL